LFHQISSKIPFASFSGNITTVFSFFGFGKIQIVPLAVDILPPVANFSSGVQANIQHATKLSQLGISLLPVMLMIGHSALSIATTRIIAEASGLSEGRFY
jgi:hypothetical protein